MWGAGGVWPSWTDMEEERLKQQPPAGRTGGTRQRNTACAIKRRVPEDA